MAMFKDVHYIFYITLEPIEKITNIGNTAIMCFYLPMKFLGCVS